MEKNERDKKYWCCQEKEVNNAFFGFYVENATEGMKDIEFCDLVKEYGGFKVWIFSGCSLSWKLTVYSS